MSTPDLTAAAQLLNITRSPESANHHGSGEEPQAQQVRPMLTSAHPAVTVAPSRFITLELATVITGLTRKAIEGKIARGDWLAGREYHRRDGRIFIDLKGYEKWVVGAVV